MSIIGVVIRKSKLPKAGKGLFAGEDIPKRTVIGQYKGKKLNVKQRDKLKNDNYVWCMSNFYIDGRTTKNNPLKYVNGAKTKKQHMLINVEAYQYANKLFYRTTKKVRKGDEFIIDYGDDFFS